MTDEELRNWRHRTFELTDENIDKIIEFNYSHQKPNSKKYIRGLIKLHGRNQNIRHFSTLVVKQDIIDEYNDIHKNDPIKLNIDFSHVPEIIYTNVENFRLYIKDTICGIEVGYINTNYRRLITLGRNVEFFKDLNYLLSIINNPDIIYSDEKTKSFIKSAEEIYGIDEYEFDQTRYVNNKTLVKIKHTKCGRYFWVQPKTFLLNKIGCTICSRERNARSHRLSFDEYAEKVKEIRGDEFDISISRDSYVDLTTKFLVKCNKCGTVFECYPFQLIYVEKNKFLCPTCRFNAVSKIRTTNSDIVQKRMEEACGPDYDFSNTEFNGMSKPCTFLKISTGEYITNIPTRVVVDGKPVVPGSKLSNGEELALNWFKNSGLNFEHTVDIRNKIMGRVKEHVVIDFTCETNNKIYWVETSGTQHYRESEFISFEKLHRQENPYSFRQQVNRDENIRQYCKENNIVFIEIPYTYYSYSKIDDILTRVILNGESPDFIKIPEIKYL